MRRESVEWMERRSSSLFCPDFEASVLFKNDYRPNRIVYANDPAEAMKFEHPFVFYASFDPRRDAKEQLKFIRDYLAERQKKINVRKTKRQFKLWPTYLRILDAVDGGCGPTKVGEILDLDPQAAAAAIRQAKSWVRDCLLIV